MFAKLGLLKTDESDRFSTLSVVLNSFRDRATTWKDLHLNLPYLLDPPRKWNEVDEETSLPHLGHDGSSSTLTNDRHFLRARCPLSIFCVADCYV